jgi:hypothetical protein
VAQEPEAAVVSARTTRILAVLVFVLFAAVFLLNRSRDGGGTASDLLFPDLKDRLAEVSAVTIVDADSEVTVTRTEAGWIIPEKDGYAADTGALRDLLLAIAEARKLEQKTSNSEYYERLGVEDPAEEGSTGVLVTSKDLGDADFALILGDAVQGEYRYVRVANAAESWLVDRNPDVPQGAGGWLAPAILDIPSSRIESASITHGDGSRIRIRKSDPEAANFEVLDIPEGRELSYPSVANGIAGALSGLTLEDVRKTAPSDGAGAPAAGGTTLTEYTTFDGLRITIASSVEAGAESAESAESEQQETWLTVAASVVAVPGGNAEEPETTATPEPGVEEPQTAATPESGAGPETAAAPEPGVEEPQTAAAPEQADERDPAEEAAAINARAAGWQYRIAEYKANQLKRLWEDLLKAEE